MTTPPQEYIITEEWVRKLEKPGRGLMWLAKRIRSRPLLSAIQQEREKLIDKFAERFRSSYIFFDDVKFDEGIESLRREP